MKYAVALAAAVLGLCAPATAATLSFTVSGAYQASWLLDSSPTPDNHNDTFFLTSNVSGDFPGSDDNIVDLYFYTYDQLLGGLGIYDKSSDTVLLDTYGEQVFTGDTSAPTFVTGTYNLISNPDGSAIKLVIADVSAPVPEPATWAMMIAGFGAVGYSMRRRKATIAFA